MPQEEPARYRAVPPQVDLPAMERDVLAFWHENDTFAAQPGADRRRRAVDVLRGPADRERHARRPPRRGPGLQGRLPAVQDHAGPPRRPQGRLGLPRAAGRDRRREGARLHRQGRHRGLRRRRVQRAVPRVRAPARRRVRGDDRADGLLGRPLGPPTGRWTRRTCRASGGRSSRSSTRACWSQDHRVAPYCPRCGTGLSDHELAQGYETVVDPSVYVRFPLTSGPLRRRGAALLVWTTTPWTLVSNTAVAVHPDVTYVAATDGTETARRRRAAAGHGPRRRLDGDRDVHRCGAGGLDLPAAVRPGRLADAEDGTSRPLRGARRLRHDRRRHRPGAPGARVRRRRPGGRPRVRAARWSTRSAPTATSTPSCRWSAGEFFKHADKTLVRDLEERGLLFRHLAYEHAYPHCWRCHTALLYYAQPSWYIRTTAGQGRAAAPRTSAPTGSPRTSSGAGTATGCTTTSTGRCPGRGYWGTPLPIWRCEADPSHLVCVGSLAELGELAGQDLAALDPHRPYVDDVILPCAEPGCGGEHATGARGHRRLVRLRLDAVRAVGVPARRGLASSGSRPPSRRSSSARRSTRPAAGSTR